MVASALLIAVSIAYLVVNVVYPDSNARRVMQGLFAISMLIWSCAILLSRKHLAEQDTL